MRSEPSLVTGVAVLAAAVAFTAFAFISSDFVFAQDSGKSRGDEVMRPSEASLPDWEDRQAALEALHTALVEMPDGASFVWRRWNGKLSGVVRPTSSFKVADGGVCRHVIVALAVEGKSRQIEGIACRQTDGSWQLD